MSLSSIIVDLRANTGDFVNGMVTASSAAKKAGKEITDSFSKFGELASSALAPFGEVGEKIGSLFSSIGRLSAGASKSLADMGGGVSHLTTVAGVAAGALAATTGAAISLAIATAYSVRTLTEEAEAVGISVQALAELQFAGKQAGVEQETLNKSLGYMANAALKAATGPTAAATAFSRLGISVKEQNGQLKEASKLFTEVITKLDGLKDRTAAVGFSKQIFGRGGQEILKFEPEELKQSVTTAKALGIAPSPQLAAQSVQFVQSINTIEAAGHGLAIKLTGELLPAISSVANEIVKAFENKSGPIWELVEGVIAVSKGFFFLVDAVITAGEQIAIFFHAAWDTAKNFAEGIKAMAKSATPTELVAAYDAYNSKVQATNDRLFNNSKKAWQDLENTRLNLFGPKPPTNNVVLEGKKTGGADLEPREKDDSVARIEKEVGALERKAAAELKLAAATGESVAAQRLQAAQTEGEEVVAKFKDEADEKLKNKKITVAEYQKILETLKTIGPRIQDAEAEIFVGKDLKTGADELQKESNAFLGHIDVLNRLVEAYRAGGQAIKDALINQALEKQKQKLQDLEEEYDRLNAKPVKDPAKIAEAAAAVANAKGSFNLDQNLVQVQGASTAAESVERQTRAFEDQLPALQALNAAYHENAQAVRDAQVNVKVAQFKTQNPFASDDTIKTFAASQKRESDETYAATVHQEAARYDLIKTYDTEVEHLTELKTVLQSYGADTLAVEAAIKEAQEKEIDGWDKVAFKMGDFSDKFRAMVNEIELQGENFGQKVFASFGKAIDDVSTQLAKFIVTGKSSFKELLQSMEEAIIKAQLQKSFSVILTKAFGAPQAQGQQGPFGASGLDNLPLTKDGVTATPPFLPNAKPPGPAGIAVGIGKLFGLGPKEEQLGTAGRPMYVKIASGLELPGATSSNSFFGGKSQQFSTAQENNFLDTGVFPGAPGAGGAGGAGGIGGVASSIAKIFGIDTKGGLGKPDGTQSNPFYMQFASMTGGSLFGGAATSSGSPFGFSGLDNLPLTNTNASSNDSGGSSSPFGPSGLDNLPLFNTNSGDNSSGSSDSSSSDSSSAGIASGIGGLVSTIGGFFSGSSNSKPTGAKGNPFYVIDASKSGVGGLGGSISTLVSAFSDSGSAAGGLISGPGTSTSDSIPRWLSDGEYVVKADAVRNVGIKNLEAINRMTFAEGGQVKGPGSSTSDSIPAMLSAGEFVVKADAVRGFGMKNLEAINRMTHTTSKSHAGNFFSSVSESAHALSNLPGITNSINFGGFREMGGDVTPGKAYLVGEKRPELFIPKTAGVIHPSVNMKGGGDQQPIVQYNTVHVHGVQTPDQWKRSQSQVAATASVMFAQAHERNRRGG